MKQLKKILFLSSEKGLVLKSFDSFVFEVKFCVVKTNKVYALKGVSAEDLWQKLIDFKP